MLNARKLGTEHARRILTKLQTQQRRLYAELELALDKFDKAS
jgi:hypothetical protein